MSYIHSDTVWYSDGTVVLESGGVAFRAYLGLISSQSHIFADMFSVPQQTGTMEMYDGVPIVHMPDSVDDLDNFLSLLHDASFQSKWIANPMPSVTKSALRLSAKYEVLHLRRTATRILLSIFPTTLDEYHTIRIPRAWDNALVLFELANLCEQIELLVVLPTVLLRCISGPFVSSVYNGTTGTWGSAAELSASNDTSGEVVELSASNKAKCIDGLEWLIGLSRLRIYPLFHKRADGCKDTTQCDRTYSYRSDLFSGLCENKHVHTLGAHLAKPVHLDCDACADKWQSAIETEQENIWQMLPSIFALPPWEQLLLEFYDQPPLLLAW